MGVLTKVGRCLAKKITSVPGRRDLVLELTGGDVEPPVKMGAVRVAINDGYCEWAFLFQLDGKQSIADMIAVLSEHYHTQPVQEALYRKVCKWD